MDVLDRYPLALVNRLRQALADQEFTVQERQGRHLNGGWHYLTEAEIDTAVSDLLDAFSLNDSHREALRRNAETPT